MQGGAVCLTYRAKNSFGATIPDVAVAASGVSAVSTSKADFSRLCANKPGRNLTSVIY